jgi:hypothetical protein
MASNAVALAQGASNNVTFRNRIINGAMVINQRAFSASATDNTYTLDRWFTSATQNSKFTVAQSSTAPAGFINSLLATSSSAYTVGAGELFTVNQYIEGLNVADFAWGTASASTVTLSFWVRSSLTGTFGGSISNSGVNRSYPFTYTISSANTFEYKTITIAGDQSGTWLTTNGIGIRIWMGLGVGSSFSGTAGSWAGADYRGATGATSVVGTNGATFYITGVQLEAGSTASPFEYRQYGTEQLLCMRYYQVMNSYLWLYPIEYGGNNYRRSAFPLPVTMRVAPTLTLVGNSGITASQQVTVNSAGWYSDGVAAAGVAYASGGYTASSEL